MVKADWLGAVVVDRILFSSREKKQRASFPVAATGASESCAFHFTAMLVVSVVQSRFTLLLISEFKTLAIVKNEIHIFWKNTFQLGPTQKRRLFQITKYVACGFNLYGSRNWQHETNGNCICKGEKILSTIECGMKCYEKYEGRWKEGSFYKGCSSCV